VFSVGDSKPNRFPHFFNVALGVSAGNDLKVGKAGKLVGKRIIRGMLQSEWDDKSGHNHID
jgi:hypothetical protein